MKTNLLCKIFSIIHPVILSHPSLSRLRIAAAGTLVLAGAGLAATSMHPPRLPWEVPTVTVGNNPVGIAVDAARHTIYVANGDDDTLSVIDSSKCKASNSSRCSQIATVTVGPNPLYAVLDPTTDTVYTSILGGNTVAVVNGATCNATNTSGCGQTPASVTVAGTPLGLALDTATHTLYVGDANDGPVSIIDTATCNATNTSGCGQTPVQTASGGDAIAIDYVNHGVYVMDFNDNVVRVFNGATCNAGNTSGCAQPPATVVANFNPRQAAVDEATHTVYVPVGTGEDTLGSVEMIDGSTCNGTINSGCGNTPNRANVGSNPGYVLIDPATETVYVENQGSSSLSVINAATCNATNSTGCARIFPALALGVGGAFISLDPHTHTLYESSQDTNAVWVLDASKCNAMHTSGCTKFEPTTTVGAGTIGVAENPNTRTLYEANQEDNTVSVIDTTACNRHSLAGCNQTWPTVPLGNTPRFLGINTITNSIYVSNRDDGTLSVINGATCNRSNTSSCSQAQPTTAVGNTPQQIAVDESTNTIYVVNQEDGTVSAINGSHCQGTDVSGCNQAWPTIAVGASPQGLDFNPNNHTLYVTNTNDNTVSVINTMSQNVVATFPVGAAPRAVGIVLDRNTVFVGNRDDLTVSVIDGSTCNGTRTSGCPQVPPPAVVVGAFPSTGGGSNILGRSIAVDQHKHIVFIPVIGDSDVATLDGNACRAGHVNDCHVKIVHKRMGGFPLVATVDEASETVYVSNDDDGTVSLFPSSR